MGFIVNYKDIVGIPSKIFSPDPESMNSEDSNQIELIYYIQIDLYNTGFIYLADENVKNKLKILRKKGRPLASFCIKINRKNLLNELLLNEEREVIAEKILGNIIKGKELVQDIPEQEQSFTNVPCFDINFKNILLTEQEEKEKAEEKKFSFEVKEELEIKEEDDKEEEEEDVKEDLDESSPIKNKVRSLEILENEKQLSVNAEIIRNNFPIIREYFGVSEKITHIENLNNQSMQPLDSLFPEIEKTEEEIIKSSKTVLDKSENQNNRHNVKLINFDEDDEKFGKLLPKSDFITEWVKEKVKKLNNFKKNSLRQ